MTPVASFGFGKLGGAPQADARPDAEPAEVQPFEAVLAGASDDAPNVPSPVDLTASTPGEDDGADDLGDENAAEETDATPEPDPAVLSSCFAMWQILPANPAAQATPAGEWSPDGENISTNFGASEDPVGQGAEQSAQLQAPVPSNDRTEQQSLTKNVTPPEESTSAIDTAPATVTVSVQSKSDSTVVTDPAPPTAIEDTAPVDPQALSTSSPLRMTPLTAHAPKPPRAAKQLETEGLRAIREPAEGVRAEANGIPVAKQQRAMSDATFHPLASPAPAAFAEAEPTVKTAHVASVEETVTITAATGRELAGDDHEAEGEGAREDNAFDFTSTIGAPHESARKSDTAAVSEKATVSNSAQAIQHVERAIERMRGQDGQRVELRLALHSGEEVVVKLRLEQGEVKVTFQTGSEGLRHALESGWSQLSQSTPDRTVRLGPAVFDAGAMQNGAGGFQQQQRQHGGDANAQGAEPSFPSLVGTRGERKAPLDVRRTPIAATAVTNLATYA